VVIPGCPDPGSVPFVLSRHGVAEALLVSDLIRIGLLSR
jgi:hypothetical protein